MTFLPSISHRFQCEGDLSPAVSARTGAGCQWIDGPVTGDDSCKCGKPVVSGLPGRAPYCADHARRCFESASAWKARNAEVQDLEAGFATVSLRDWLGGLD
ncbi:hypothetical protein [Hwanghaeella sp.]|uniref:hypothetical protein n=1 Tax=Hwanghaeella sp. TaxID=2605943 RepID=UPI003CCC0DD6